MKKRLATVALAGCFGCHMSFLDMDERLLELIKLVEVDRSPLNDFKKFKKRCDIGLIEGGCCNEENVHTLQELDRSSVANIVRLLTLPHDVREEVLAGRMSMGHARAILALESEAEQRNFARDAVARGWTVRETEQMVTRALTHPGAGGPAKKSAAPREVDVHTRAAQDKLRLTFGTKVDIARKGKGGEIRIAFKSEEELIRIYEILVRE